MDLVRALRLAAVAEAPDAFATTLERERARTAEDWRRWLSPGITLLSVHDTGRVVGMVAGVLDDDGTGAVVAAMWVDPDLRGRGAGDGLMAGLTDWARRTRRRLHLHVVEGNAPAVGLYERHGFHLTGQARIRSDGVREVEMTHTGWAVTASP